MNDEGLEPTCGSEEGRGSRPLPSQGGVFFPLTRPLMGDPMGARVDHAGVNQNACESPLVSLEIGEASP